MVPDWLFDVREKVFLGLPYCQQNEEDVKKLINHLTIITKEKFQFNFLWTTSTIQSLFPIKDKVCHISSVKWSDPGHFLRAQGKLIFLFPCTLFYIFLTPKNYKSIH